MLHIEPDLPILSPGLADEGLILQQGQSCLGVAGQTQGDEVACNLALELGWRAIGNDSPLINDG
jgi:hypothetical protein